MKAAFNRMDEAAPGDHPVPGNFSGPLYGHGRPPSPSKELRTGFTIEIVEQLRHSTIRMDLKKWYMENYIDPAGFDITEAAFGRCYASTIGASSPRAS